MPFTMNDDFTNIDKVSRYLDDQLSPSEKSSFEADLASSIQLQKEVENLKTSRSAVALYGLKQTVNQVHQQMMTEMKPVAKKISSVRTFARITLRVAASIILITLAFGVIEYYNV